MLNFNFNNVLRCVYYKMFLENQSGRSQKFLVFVILLCDYLSFVNKDIHLITQLQERNNYK